MKKYIVVNPNGDPIFATVASTREAAQTLADGLGGEPAGYQVREWYEDGDSPFVRTNTGSPETVRLG